MAHLVRLEIKKKGSDSWATAHAGVALLSPENYVARMAKNGHIARAVEWETDVVYGDSKCPYCDAVHPERYDGRCML